MTVTDDWAAVLADGELDGVVIATPTSTHFPLASEALECGKHVLVEKPLTDSADTSQRLVVMADELDRVLMVGHVFLFNPAIEAAKQLIDDGELGPIHYISMNRTNLGPVRVDVNAGWDLASHDISIASHWLGATPLYASATGGSWINPGVHDALFITLTYPEDVLVHIEVSWLHPRKDRLISVVGGARMATVDDIDLSEPLRVYDKGVAVSDADLADTFAGFRSQIREGTVTIPRIPGGEPLRRECEAFIARLSGDRSTLSDGREALAVVQTLSRSFTINISCADSAIKLLV